MIEEEDIESIEKFVISMYDRSSTSVTVDDARLELFARKQRSYENIPPTRAALVEHSKRAAYQAACIWSRALESQSGQETPAEWGWVQGEDCWKVHWTTLPTVAKSCQQFTKCGCKTPCNANRQCKCNKVKLPCTPLCTCPC